MVRGRSEEATVRDVMTRNPICVTEDEPVSKLVELLLEQGITSTPVIDEGGRPIGVVSKSDLVRGFCWPRGNQALVRALGREVTLENARVSDVMTKTVYLLKDGTSLGDL